MAAIPSTETVQVVNVDLAPERQHLLRERLDEVFGLLARRSRTKKRLVYTVNADDDPLDKVVRLNPDADAVLTGFDYDVRHSEAYKERVAVASPAELAGVDPQLRYPVIAEYQALADRGAFRHRRLILVGDVYDKLCRFVRSDLPLSVSVYTNAERTEATQPMAVTAIERLDPEPAAEYAEGAPLPVSRIATLRVADIAFDGVINMPEEGNRFVFRDQSVVDTARRLYLARSVRERVTRELIAEDKLHHVRGKRVLIVLDPDLEHIVAERLTFDRMDNLWRRHSLAEALETLERGQSGVITDHFEREGYGLIFEALEQGERDRLLVALLGERLPEFLARELRTVRPMVGQLDDEDTQSLFYNLPAPLLDAVLEAVKERAYDRFLTLVPPRIREQVILEFLRTPRHAQAAWRGIDEAERKAIVQQQGVWLLADMQLIDSDLFKRRFPDLSFEFQRTYHSSMLGRMGPDQQQATLAFIARGLEQAGLGRSGLAGKLSAEEVERFMLDTVQRQPPEFYNRLNPLVRKQIWQTVGREYREHISKGLHALDKIDILKGLKAPALEALLGRPDLLEHFRGEDEREAAGNIFLLLKKLNKTESRHALLKKLLESEDWKARRLEAVPAFLTDPENRGAWDKLADRVEELELRFDSLICTRADHAQLKDREPLRGAVVTLVDDLVDPSLFDLFAQGRLGREEYDAFSRDVEARLAELRRKLSAREKEDPASVYLVETMQILHDLANQSLRGEVTADALLKVDARQEIRRRLIDSFRENVRRIDEFLARAERLLEQFGAKAAQVEAAAEKQEAAYQREYQQAAGLLAECQRLLAAQAEANEQRRRVALTQRELSLEFFEIIQPLILDKVRSLGSPLRKLARLVGLGGGEGATPSRRVIFRFTDEQIEQILRYRIVFCAKDPVLAQFVATCLRIDGLEDSLFTLATAETLPHKSDIDILFYGPGYSVDDFSDSVHRRRMVPFADEAFYRRLLANEQLKARTKAALGKVGQELAQKKHALGQANQAVKAQQARRRQLREALTRLQGERTRLEETLARERERRLAMDGEREVLDARLAEVDARFERVKERLATLAEGGRAAVGQTLDAGRAEMGEALRDELTGLNRELARMMYIKGVKDAGGTISSNTQQGMLGRLEARERFDAGRPPARLIVADDGSSTAQNLKRVFVNAALTHFKLRDTAVQELSIGRLAALAERAEAKQYPFLALFAERPGDDYAGLKQVVKTVRKHLPEAYQLVVTPCGDLGQVERDSPYYRNLLILRDHGALVNSALADYSDPATMLRALQERAPAG